MGTPVDLVNRRDAIRLLGVNDRTICKMVRQGMLKQVFIKRKSFFSRTDVETLSKTFNGKTDFSAVTNLALRAFKRAEAAERKVREISELLGLSVEFLDMEEPAIIAFYEEVKRRLDRSPPTDPADVMLLAKKLNAISEEYLKLVERLTGDKEPWNVFMELANYLMVRAPRKYFLLDQPLAAAYGYMEAARRHLRAVSFFRVQVKYGRKIATDAFLGSHVTDDVIDVMFPH